MANSNKVSFSRVKAEDYVDMGLLEQEDKKQETNAPSSGEFASMVDESVKFFKEGEIIKGTIINKTDDAVLVDVGYKSEGLIPLSEFGREAADLAPGDTVEVMLDKTEDNEGVSVLSKEKVNRIRIWEKMAEKFENDEIIEGVVFSKIKGGLTVEIGRAHV